MAVVCLWVPQASGNKSFKIDKSREALSSITHKNLTLFPVVSRKVIQRDYTVLDSGMKAGTVKVLETGSVNKLTLVNKSAKPLFLMAGEVVIGGKQDRIIGKDTIIPAKSKENVPVYCVEHGRWAGRKVEFASTGALAHTKLRKRAKYSNQSKVWEEVAAKNKKRAESNSTQTYRKIATGKKTRAAVRSYQRHFAKQLSALKKRTDVVGFVVVLNGKVVAIETFRSNKLFRKMQNKLLRSYYVEAVDAGHDKKAKRAGAQQVHAFMKRVKAAKRRVVRSSKGAKTYELNASGIVGSTVSDRAIAKPAPKKGQADAESAADYSSMYAH